MSRYYVDITGIPDDFLEFLGYCKLLETEEFELRDCKGEPYILLKDGKRYLYVEDANDAAIFRVRSKVAAPPPTPTPAKSKQRKTRRKRA